MSFIELAESMASKTLRFQCLWFANIITILELSPPVGYFLQLPSPFPLSLEFKGIFLTQQMQVNLVD